MAGGTHSPVRTSGDGQYRRRTMSNLPAGAGSQFERRAEPVRSTYGFCRVNRHRAQNIDRQHLVVSANAKLQNGEPGNK